MIRRSAIVAQFVVLRAQKVRVERGIITGGHRPREECAVGWISRISTLRDSLEAMPGDWSARVANQPARVCREIFTDYVTVILSEYGRAPWPGLG